MHATKFAPLLTLAALAAPATAGAHVTVQPDQAQAGAYTVEDVRVPNETDDAVTTQVRLQLPDGFAEAAYEAVPGWSVKVVKTKLATPVKTDDGEVTEQVSQITWTADDRRSGVQPGAFQDFPLSVQIPDRAGTSLTFKALQTYSDGKVVRWIGAPDSDTPAPQVEVSKAGTAEHVSAAAKPAASAAPAVSGGGDDGSSDGLAIVALVVGGLGLLAGVAGFAAGRRRAAAA